tara:strand:- start:2638 stop:3048 length:411 start_codon:yes stop_codon:yes gene_type:complete
MNCNLLMDNLIDENYEDFKTNLSMILDQKFANLNLDSVIKTVENVFEHKKTLNNEEPNFEVIDVLQENAKQNSNTSLVLADRSEVILKPFYSESILNTFDKLNEENQVKLINNLFSSKTRFENTVDFCTRYKRKAK